MAPPVRKYNPGFLTDDELVASFCIRTTELEMLLEALRDCTGPANQHQIVIGPRGSGKTTLLLRVAAEARRDAALAAHCFPIIFAEESYEVSTAGEFWLESLTLLAAQAPCADDQPDLHRTVDDLRTIRDDRTLADRCLAALLDFAHRHDQRLLLLVENLNMLFRDMMDRDAGWRLRKVLQTEPRIILFASATSRFQEIDHPEHALYDLFRVRTLRPLDTAACEILWSAVTGRTPLTPTIRSLEILTGGNPRLLAIVARFGATRSFRKLMADLLDLVDDHTEYFKSHLDSLAAQERRVYLALAALWKPATTREIADQARLDTNTCSAQLARLGTHGAVQVTGGSARRKQYYLTERLYNIYYLLRRQRGPDRLVEALIRFMESYYSPDDLKEIASSELGYLVRDQGRLAEPLYRSALHELLASPVLAPYHRELGIVYNSHLDTDPDQFTATLFAKMRVLVANARSEDALATCDQLLHHLRRNERDAVLPMVAEAVVIKGTILGVLNRPQDALGSFDEVIDRFGQNQTPIMQEWVALALVNKAVALATLNRPQEALHVCDHVIERFGQNSQVVEHVRERKAPVLLQYFAAALAKRAHLLGVLNRPQDAVDVCDQIIERFGERETPTTGPSVAAALAIKGAALNALKRPHHALEVCDQAVDLFGDWEIPDTLQWMATTLVNKGAALSMLNRPQDALAVYEQVVERFGQAEAPALIEPVSLALMNKVNALSALNRPKDALAACDEVVNRFGKSDFPTLLVGEAVTKALLVRATARFDHGDRRGCERDIQETISIFAKGIPLSSTDITALIGLSVDLGPRRMSGLIRESPAADLLLPLTTALDLETGNEPRVAREVDEVAQDIRQRLEDMKQDRKRKAAQHKG